MELLTRGGKDAAVISHCSLNRNSRRTSRRPRACLKIQRRPKNRKWLKKDRSDLSEDKLTRLKAPSLRRARGFLLAKTGLNHGQGG
jgi:hypothetical protein